MIACILLAAALADIKPLIADFKGTVSVYAKNLDTGAEYGVRADDRVRTASTIKLAVMAAVFAEVEAGKAKWTDQLVLRDGDKVEGSGVLRELADGTRLSLRDLVHLMIVVSDNTATNLLLDRFPPALVNAWSDRAGLTRTRVNRKVMDTKAEVPPNLRPYGLGVTTPREMVMLLERISKSKEMIEILKRQQYKDGIGRHSPYPVASKSGSLDRLRSDVGIVYSPRGRIAIAVTVDALPATDWSHDNPGEKLIWEITHVLVDTI